MLKLILFVLLIKLALKIVLIRGIFIMFVVIKIFSDFIIKFIDVIDTNSIEIILIIKIINSIS